MYFFRRLNEPLLSDIPNKDDGEPELKLHMLEEEERVQLTSPYVFAQDFITFGDRRMSVKGQQTLYELCRQWVYNNPNPALIRISNIDGVPLKESSSKGEEANPSTHTPLPIPKEIADLKFLEEEYVGLDDHTAWWRDIGKIEKEGAKNKITSEAKVLHSSSMQLRNA